jgi:hypothetical protein
VGKTALGVCLAGKDSTHCRPNRANRRKSGFRGATKKSVFVASSSMLLALAPAAMAGACSGYQYQEGGKYNSATGWRGVEGQLNEPTESVPNFTTSHIASYVSMWEGGTNTCPHAALGQCQIQTGIVIGAGPGNCVRATAPVAYAEENDVNAYVCNFFPQLPLASSDYFTTFYTGTCNGANQGLTDAYYFDGSVWSLVAQAWLPNCAASKVLATTEFEEVNHTATACPVLTKYQTFGYTTKILYDSSNGSTWTPWTSSQKNGPRAPVQISPTTVQSSDRFKSWG